MPLLLLFASPLSRVVIVGSTLVVGTGCSETTVEDCDQFRDECVQACPEGDGQCLVSCDHDHTECVELAYADQQRRAEQAEAAAEAGLACVAVLACTLEAIGDGDGDGDGDADLPPPDSQDDWGEDWGERDPDEVPELSSPNPLPDLPDSELD